MSGILFEVAGVPKNAASDPVKQWSGDMACLECQVGKACDALLQQKQWGTYLLMPSGRAVRVQKHTAMKRLPDLLNLTSIPLLEHVRTHLSAEVETMAQVMAADFQYPLSGQVRTYIKQLGSAETSDPSNACASIGVKAFTRPSCYLHNTPEDILKAVWKEIEEDSRRAVGLREGLGKATGNLGAALESSIALQWEKLIREHSLRQGEGTNCTY